MQSQALIQEVLARPTYRARARDLRAHRDAFSAPLIDSFLGQAEANLRRDPMQARQSARLALYVARSMQDPGARLRCLRVLAQADILAGRYPEALRAIDESLRLLRPDGSARERAEARALRVQVLTQLERYAEAGETGRNVLRALEALGDERGVVRIRMALADLAIQLGRPRDALRHYRQVEYLLPEDAAPRLRGAIAANRGNALQARHRFRASERWLQRARAIFVDQGCDHTVAQIDYNLAYSAVLRGRYDEALRLYADVEARFERLGDDMHRAHIDLNRAELYMHLHLPDEARGHAERAERAFGRLGLERDRAQALYFAGRAAALSGELVEAAGRYAEAGGVFATLHLDGWEAKCVVQQAYLAQRLGRPQDARRLAREARNHLEPASDPLVAASVWLLDAHLDLTAHEPTEAIEKARTCTVLLRRVHAPWMRVEAGRVEGLARRALGQPRRAIDALRTAVDVLENHRGGVPPDETMSAFLGARAELYEDLVDLLVCEGRAEEAFGYAERAKSRALLDLLAHRAVEASPVEGPHGARIRVLRETLNAVTWQRFQSGGGAEPVDPLTAQAAHRRAADLEDELRRLLRDRHHAAPSGAVPVAVPAPDALRAQLDAETAFVDYLLTKSGLITFVVTRARVWALRQDLEAGEIEERVQRLRFHLAKHERREAPPAALVLQATRDNLARLRERLVDPIEDRLDCRRLVICAHGPLHGVPFHALPYGDGWLCERFEIVYAPSAAVYAHCAQVRPRALGQPVVLGVPDAQAPHVEREARQVAEVLQTPRLLLGADATLEALRAAAPKASILHLATHGVFRRANPALSALRLGDGWASLYDLQALRIAGGLVVLSTCESGVAGVSAGNEILGIARGLLHAGAPALLCSQWRVRDDVAAAFMQAFYEALGTGQGPAAAHRHAMAAVRRDHPHPFFWAPFFLLGAPLAGSVAMGSEPLPPLLLTEGIES